MYAVNNLLFGILQRKYRGEDNILYSHLHFIQFNLLTINI